MEKVNLDSDCIDYKYPIIQQMKLEDKIPELGIRHNKYGQDKTRH